MCHPLFLFLGECKYFCTMIEKSSMTVSLGSCFSAEMGERMTAHGYRVCNNPFGVLYNPVSVMSSLLRLSLSSQTSATRRRRDTV